MLIQWAQMSVWQDSVIFIHLQNLRNKGTGSCNNPNFLEGCKYVYIANQLVVVEELFLCCPQRMEQVMSENLRRYYAFTKFPVHTLWKDFCRSLDFKEKRYGVHYGLYLSGLLLLNLQSINITGSTSGSIYCIFPFCVVSSSGRSFESQIWNSFYISVTS